MGWIGSGRNYFTFPWVESGYVHELGVGLGWELGSNKNDPWHSRCYCKHKHKGKGCIVLEKRISKPLISLPKSSSLSHDQIIVLGVRDKCVWTKCPESFRDYDTARNLSWSRVRRPNHYITTSNAVDMERERQSLFAISVKQHSKMQTQIQTMAGCQKG